MYGSVTPTFGDVLSESFKKSYESFKKSCEESDKKLSSDILDLGSRVNTLENQSNQYITKDKLGEGLSVDENGVVSANSATDVEALKDEVRHLKNRLSMTEL